MRHIFTTLVIFIWTAMPARGQQEAANPRTLSVSGEGIVYATPDMATVRFGVVTQDQDPEAARQRNAAAAREAMNAVRALGVEENKLRLETLRLQPAREYDPETRRYKEIGFEAVREVVVEVEDLEMLPELIATVVQKGANRLSGITYDLKERDPVRNEALSQALLGAREKARLMASTLDVALGNVLSIHEQSFDFPRPILQRAASEAMMAKDMNAAPEPEAYAAGEIEVRATVQVIFELQ